ncbi:hypothetical protein [Noviherbaspirillum pedocola]|uniref:Uncharacterized protein n=1 Tax=Noviherbaspirillum pedocola TaxID=2801341 RepID=A0A934W6U2_9BURK|nr:hypothetical protein [Noviherbaspirillum pedocola]MBK4734788.1 hypothetical protein [Noviherbaspirillum pedocola]
MVKEQVYAKLAESIEAAWIEAWGKIAAAQADGKYQVDVLSSSSSDAGQTSSSRYADENWDPFFFLDAPYVSNASMAALAFKAGSAPMPNFAESSACKALLAEFRIVLKRMINAPGTNILRLPGAPAEAEGIYSDLMFRQLHMLAQFIDEKPEVDVTPSSS